MPHPRRDHLVETALRLFASRGFHATGIDTILAEAGVAKMTLYHHFSSKEELILAALRLRDERLRNWLMKRVRQRAEDPALRLLAIFDVLGESCERDDFSGCTFINASAEYGDLDCPIHAAAAEHKRLLRNYVRDLAASAGAPDPDALSKQLFLLMDGAIVGTKMSGKPDALCHARQAAKVLVDHAIS